MFSALRQSGTVYILTKGDTPALKTGVVQSVTSPVTKFGTQLMPGQFQQDTVIDLTVKVGDELLTFKQLPSASVIASSGNMVVSESRDAMVAEVENMMRTSKEVLESVDYHRSALEACESIMCSLNPRLAEEKEQKVKIETLERKIGGIEASLENMTEMLSKALKSSKS
jgi:chaperonin cofactor prefoldin